jgi:hypothetical protein
MVLTWGRDVSHEQIPIGSGVEGTIVVNQEIDGVAQVVMAAREILEPDGKVGWGRRNPLLGHAPHRPSGHGRGIVVIRIFETGIHCLARVLLAANLAPTP